MTARRPAADAVAAASPEDGPEDERLAPLARLMEPHVRDTLTRLALAPGARVLAYGRGPLAALRPLAAAIGPDGVVVALARGGAARDQAPARGAAQGRGAVHNVHLVRAALTTLTPAAVCPPGPFDLAYGHAVLCAQHDVVAVLRRLAATVRPGGYLVAQEVLLTASLPVAPAGRFPRAANLLMTEWLPAVLGTRGACWDVAERYSMLCREAGLVEVGQRLFAPTLPPAQAGAVSAVYRALLADVRPLLRRYGIASEGQIARAWLDLDLAGAADQDATVFTHSQVELVARVP